MEAWLGLKKQRKEHLPRDLPTGPPLQGHPAPNLGTLRMSVGSTELLGLKWTDLGECGWEEKSVFLGRRGDPFSPQSHNMGCGAQTAL